MLPSSECNHNNYLITIDQCYASVFKLFCSAIIFKYSFRKKHTLAENELSRPEVLQTIQ